MSKESKKRETADRHAFGDDEAMSLAEALLAMDSPTVQQLDAAIPNDAQDRRAARATEDVVAGSVFGRPEPAVTIVGRPSAAAGGRVSSIRSVAISDPATMARQRSIAAALPSASRRTPVGQRVTVALAILFVAAFSGSVLLTILGRESDASLETTTEPTVEGVTTLATNPPPSTAPTTTTPPTTAAATTAAPTTAVSSTTVPTAAASSTSVTTAPTTTASSTTAPPATTRPPTTRPPTTRPPTTRRPTTTAPPTTRITIPDITFAPPTWQGTGDPPP